MDARAQGTEGHLDGYDGRFDSLDGSVRGVRDGVTELRQGLRAVRGRSDKVPELIVDVNLQLAQMRETMHHDLESWNLYAKQNTRFKGQV